MSSFLQQLKSGGFEIDNRKSADATGTMVRRVEKRFVGETVEKLGLRLGDDAEVLEVTKGSLAAKANIPCHYMIFDVNGVFIESNSDFVNLVNSTQSLNLVIKLQSVSGMSELIAMTIRDEENRDANLATAEDDDGTSAAPRLDYDELQRTTPRFNFLSVSHPLFRRYNNRLQEKREAAALVRRRMQETEEQLRRERSEMIRREMEAAAEEERKKKQAEEERLAAEKARAAAAAAAAAANAEAAAQDSFIKVVNDESTFANLTTSGDNMQDNAIQSSPTPEPQVSAPPEIQPSAEVNEVPDTGISAAELLSLIGVVTPVPAPAADAPAVAPSTSILGAGNPSKAAIVTCVTLPTEEYTLSTGEKVFCSLKKRTGPIPNPPPGNPPHVKRSGAHGSTPGSASMKRPRE